jgi:signal transduction histidine kinase
VQTTLSGVKRAVSSKSGPDILSPKLPVRLASLIFALVMIVVTGVIAYFTEAGVMNSRTWVVHTYQVKTDLEELQATLNEMRASGELYLLSNDKAELLRSREQATRIRDLAGTVQRLTQDNPTQQRRLDVLRPLMDTQIAQSDSFVDTYTQGPLAGADLRRSLDEASDRREQIAASIEAMQAEEERLLKVRLNTWDSLFKRNIITLGATFAIAAILLAYNFRQLLSEIARREETEKLQRQNAESYRALSARILELQDVERRKIARELHDSVGQYLTGLKLNLGHLQSREARAIPENPALLSETIELMDRAIGEVRTISHLLHPPLLDELGFDSAARWYMEGFSKRSGIEVKMQVDDIVERLPKHVELALFRVLQEALTNVHRHAQAHLIQVTVACTDEAAVLVVQDDGKGIPNEVLENFRMGLASGIGLAGMRERLAELGGTLEVQSGADGSILRAALPVTVGERHEDRLTAL